MKKIAICLLIILTSVISWGQGFEGEVTYRISYKNLPDSIPAMYKAMLPKKTKLVIKNEWSKIEQNVLVAKVQIITNSKTKKNITLMRGMGQKIAIESMDTTQPSASQFNVTKSKKIKIIAGYKCTKTVLKDTSDNSITLWVTKDLPAYKNSNLPDMDLGGFPMEFSFEKEGMKLRMTARKVTKKKIKDSEFQIPEGYEKKTPEEMGEMMQGMDFGAK